MNTVIFYLNQGDRSLILSKHFFYVNQAKARVLSQFNDVEIDRETKAFEDRQLERFNEQFDPDTDDPDSAYEEVEELGIAHWIDLMNMRDTITLALTAGMFHEFDKMLRERIIRELKYSSLPLELIKTNVWNNPFHEIINILEWFGIPLQSQPFIEKIDALKLIVNVYKHGEGKAHTDLKSKYPEYYTKSQFSDFIEPEHLRVSAQHFEDLAKAITDFWMYLPERITDNNICDEKQPRWLKRYVEKQLRA